MRIILTGATGFAGGEVLRQALLDQTISGITSLVRRPSGITHTKLTEIILPNFLDYSAVDFARFLAPIGSLIALVNDTLAVDCDQLARVMIDIAKHGSPEPVLDNMQIRNWPIRNEKAG